MGLGYINAESKVLCLVLAAEKKFINLSACVQNSRIDAYCAEFFFLISLAEQHCEKFILYYACAYCTCKDRPAQICKSTEVSVV